MSLSKMIATCGGIGYLKGGGTIAAILFAILWWLVPAEVNNLPVQVVVFLLVLMAGVWIAGRLESQWGKDSGKIVIDEVAGMSCSLLLVPHHWQYGLTAFVFFRFFDIVKPLYISSAEKLPGGWGVMLDDVAAGVYANLLLQGILATKVF